MFHRAGEEEIEKPKAKKGQLCPLFQKDVSQCCHKCRFYDFTKVWDPETDVTERYWDCSFRLQNKNQWDFGAAMRSVYEVLESFREEAVDRQDILTDLMAIGMGTKGREALARLLEEKRIDRERRQDQRKIGRGQQKSNGQAPCA